MNARELISQNIIPLRSSDSGKFALDHMIDYHVRHLPIVENELLIGLVSEDDILHYDTQEAVGTYDFSFERPTITETAHIYDVMHLMAEYQLTLVPVVNDQNKYIGTIVQYDLLKAFANMASLADHGSIIVLETARHNYSLSEIARIVEAEDAIILSSFITSLPDSTEIEITLKVSKQNIGGIVAAFQRFSYIVKGSSVEDSYTEGLEDNYNMLLHYLNV
jgi:acetoin utilization protein AcuB